MRFSKWLNQNHRQKSRSIVYDIYGELSTDRYMVENSETKCFVSRLSRTCIGCIACAAFKSCDTFNYCLFRQWLKQSLRQKADQNTAFQNYAPVWFGKNNQISFFLSSCAHSIIRSLDQFPSPSQKLTKNSKVELFLNFSISTYFIISFPALRP